MSDKIDANISSCYVLIKNTCLPSRDVLLAISSLRQSISWLHLEKIVLRPETRGGNPTHTFKIDPSATYINIGMMNVLTKAIKKDLGQQLSTCYNLETLRTGNCHLSENDIEILCKQFAHFSNPKRFNLSRNVLGEAVSVLAEGIKSWGVNNTLQYLNLQYCNITPDGCSRLLEALEFCINLSWLDLSHNILGGTFGGLISKPVYPSLSSLHLNDTSLTSGDIQSIGSLIKKNKMPDLYSLHFSYDNVDNLELETLESLES